MFRLAALAFVAAASASRNDPTAVFHKATSLVDDDNWWNQHLQEAPAPATEETPFGGLGVMLKSFAERMNKEFGEQEQEQEEERPRLRVIRMAAPMVEQDATPPFPAMLMVSWMKRRSCRRGRSG